MARRAQICFETAHGPKNCPPLLYAMCQKTELKFTCRKASFISFNAVCKMLVKLTHDVIVREREGDLTHIFGKIKWNICELPMSGTNSMKKVELKLNKVYDFFSHPTQVFG